MDKLSDRFMYYCGLLATHGVSVDDLKHIQNLIDKEEQGLIAEVIRCKDCKYFSGGGLWDNGHWCGRTARVGDCDKVKENDFCSRAEALAKMGGK